MITASRDWDLWSTRARLVVTNPDTLQAAASLVDHLLADIEQAASRFRADSEIRTLRPVAGQVLLSPLLADLVSEALRTAEDTDGAVDPTVGTTLVDLGYDRDIELILDRNRPVARIRPVPGYRTLTLRGRELTLPSHRVQLDLGATAKAVAADRCAALIADRLPTGALVSLGGDIATGGPAPDGGWQVTVHDTPEDTPVTISVPAGAAIATSSTVRRRWRRGAQAMHHIVDPATSRPASRVWRSVTVGAASCVVANGAATAAVVKGHSAPGWLVARGLPARLVDRTGAVHLVAGWPEEAAA